MVGGVGGLKVQFIYNYKKPISSTVNIINIFCEHKGRLSFLIFYRNIRYATELFSPPPSQGLPRLAVRIFSAPYYPDQEHDVSIVVIWEQDFDSSFFQLSSVCGDWGSRHLYWRFWRDLRPSYKSCECFYFFLNSWNVGEFFKASFTRSASDTFQLFRQGIEKVFYDIKLNFDIWWCQMSNVKILKTDIWWHFSKKILKIPRVSFKISAPKISSQKSSISPYEILVEKTGFGTAPLVDS